MSFLPWFGHDLLSLHQIAIDDKTSRVARRSHRSRGDEAGHGDAERKPEQSEFSRLAADK